MEYQPEVVKSKFLIPFVQLVKDMARWAKSMNSSKHSFKKSMGGMEGRDWVAGAADAGFAMLMKKVKLLMQGLLCSWVCYAHEKGKITDFD